MDNFEEEISKMNCGNCKFCRELYVPPIYGMKDSYICIYGLTVGDKAMYLPNKKGVCELYDEDEGSDGDGFQGCLVKNERGLPV